MSSNGAMQNLPAELCGPVIPSIEAWFLFCRLAGKKNEQGRRMSRVVSSLRRQGVDRYLRSRGLWTQAPTPGT